jgi:predicted PurR-regulated permease PerM
LAIELGATGQYGRAGVVVVVGAGVHSLVDNFIRPLFARYGRLTMPTFVVFVSMIGGVAVVGAAGALLGPLLARLCIESLSIAFDIRSGAGTGPAETRAVRDGDASGLDPGCAARATSQLTLK